MTKIQVSVIIPSYNSSETIEKCLTSLTQQDNRENFEIIVVDSSNDQTSTIIKQNFPDIKLYTFTERKYAGVARNFGISQSIGEIIAFTDSDCFVESNWINQIIEIHQKTEQPLIGGAIDNGNPESYIGWGYYFSSFSRWLPASQEEQKTDLATGCLTVKKWLFEKLGGFSEDRFCEDTLFSWKISQGGYLLLFSPRIKVFHINIIDVQKFLTVKIKHGITYAQFRMKAQNFSLIKRLIYIISFPLLPLIILAKKAQEIWKAKVYIYQFIITIPVTFLGIISWSYGELLGYLKGVNN